MTRELITERLILRGPDESSATSLADYQLRNRAHLDPWGPPAPEGFFGEQGQRERLQQALRGEAAGTSQAFWLLLKDAPQRIIGHARLSQIERGPFCSAMLGYSIDATCEGRGLMQEALRAVIENAFSGDAPLHRIQANVRTENVRSSSLLVRLGFAQEGFAPHYLFIDGAWRDHLMFALRNPAWPVDRAPPIV